MELFGYDLKLLIVAAIAVLTWIFIVAGLATPFAEASGSSASLFEYCDAHACDHTYLCTSVATTAHGGAAFGVMSILAWSLMCGIFVGRIFFPAVFDRPQIPMVIYVGCGVIEFMLLIGWACAFGALHAKCDTTGSYSDIGYSTGACGVLLLFAWFFIPALIAVEWKMPSTKSVADNYNAVGSNAPAPQHVAVSSDTQYNGGNNASGYAEVSAQ